ncbi:MAG: helix-turn-helix domain-containing protein [Leptolyngbyaceae cyanobacterium RM1_405_57]|nr:helix-turn-helix domain-containing protein [Leptolyngbyaceae cyanobacterium RM1_405_57]
MTSTIRERRQQVADFLKTQGQAALSAIAETTGLSRSSVHRHQQSIERAEQYPESSGWETQVGYRWLVRLVIAVVYHFGIKQGVGAESLSAFFKAIHLDTHIGSSPTALRQLKHRVEAAIVEYASAQTEDCQPTDGQGVWLGADETFFGLSTLVLMELASGFIFTEVETEDRTYNTWTAQIPPEWEKAGWHCHSLVSDEARSLIKLATTGLGTVSVADLFHTLRNLGRPLGRSLGKQLAQVDKQAKQLLHRLSQAASDETKTALQAEYDAVIQQQQRVINDQQRYRQTRQAISLSVHPFDLETTQWQLATDLRARLSDLLPTLNALAADYGGASALSAVTTFERQIPALAQGVHLWWRWATQALSAETQDPEVQSWLLTVLLPWLYWSQQASKTRTPHLKHRYQQTASNAFNHLMAAEVTLTLQAEDLLRWLQWGRRMCANYQRTSSAVEGRNGYLAQRHHASRGFSAQALTVLTVLHNFDLKRPDGTTAVQRLFGHGFPDLFESVLSTFTELPMPRRSSSLHQPNPWYGQPVPA